MASHWLARKLHQQSQMSYPSGLKQMQISSSPSPREFAHLQSALESSAERIHEERGEGELEFGLRLYLLKMQFPMACQVNICL